jgi:hypothetical protein
MTLAKQSPGASIHRQLTTLLKDFDLTRVLSVLVALETNALAAGMKRGKAGSRAVARRSAQCELRDQHDGRVHPRPVRLAGIESRLSRGGAAELCRRCDAVPGPVPLVVEGACTCWVPAGRVVDDKLPGHAGLRRLLLPACRRVGAVDLGPALSSTWPRAACGH